MEKLRGNSMNELRIIVCEDEPEESRELRKLIADSGINVRTEIYESGEALLNAYHPDICDLIFMDIRSEEHTSELQSP